VLCIHLCLRRSASAALLLPRALPLMSEDHVYVSEGKPLGDLGWSVLTARPPQLGRGGGGGGCGFTLTGRPATIVHNWAKIRTRATRVSVKCFQLSTMKDHRVLTFQALSFVGAKERERETGSFPSLTVGNRKAVTVGQTTSHIPCLRFPLMKGKTQNVKIL